MKIAFATSPSPLAQEALAVLEKRYGSTPLAEADVVVVLGGDGHVLKTLHTLMDKGKPVYALRRTSAIGFLCNDFSPDLLIERIQKAQTVVLHPVKVECTKTDGSIETGLAINEVTLLRDSAQSAKLRVCVDGIERINRYSGDGLLLSTPAGSTAYNHSAGGPIMPLDSNTLVMTAICGFRPRRWSYAVLPQSSVIQVEVIEIDKRPVRVEAGPDNIRDVASARMWLDCTTAFSLLFDPDQHLGERIIREQFML
ncbi:MAG: NAD kinase [Alphaproteobacteria bacterium]|nr:NAD kinase [Alphaproteobacteria bacterium]